MMHGTHSVKHNAQFMFILQATCFGFTHICDLRTKMPYGKSDTSMNIIVFHDMKVFCGRCKTSWLIKRKIFDVLFVNPFR